MRGETLYEASLQRTHEQEADEEIVTKPHRLPNGEASEAQKDQRQKFSEARLYAQATMSDPAIRALYEKRASREDRVPYRVALSDYLKGKNLLSG